MAWYYRITCFTSTQTHNSNVQLKGKNSGFLWLSILFKSTFSLEIFKFFPV